MLFRSGVARFKASGVAWQDAERLARDEHAAFKVTDDWAGLVLAQLALQQGTVYDIRRFAPGRFAGAVPAGNGGA